MNKTHENFIKEVAKLCQKYNVQIINPVDDCDELEIQFYDKDDNLVKEYYIDGFCFESQYKITETTRKIHKIVVNKKQFSQEDEEESDE